MTPMTNPIGKTLISHGTASTLAVPCLTRFRG
jgi:hypothetical protein